MPGADQRVCPRVRACERSPIRLMFGLAEATADGQDLVRLEVGDPDFDTPAHVVERVAGVDGVSAPRPDGAFYAFLGPETDEASLPLAKRLLREEGVVLAPGSGFGAAGEGYLRLSFANSLDRLAEGFDRLEGAF